MTAQMGLAIVAGAIAAAFINIDKFKSFKGAGFEAELQKVVEEHTQQWKPYARWRNL